MNGFSSHDIFFLKNIFLFERCHCIMYSVTFKNDVKLLSTGTITLGVLKKYFNTFYHYEYSILLTCIYTNSHIFSSTALGAWDYSTSFFCSTFCQSHFLYISCHLQPTKQCCIYDTSLTRVALHGFLHPVITIILLNSLWNLNHLPEKQKVPFPSSNHCKETKPLH